ncbi:MAG: aminotransferase class V-fold PLP-dependent enzyme [Candidatus Poribacteria bacterium]|nr:aminotransferase class V-fold PLP-dependent enzyme [Candidatus Poribacteria bacterium]
MSHAGRSIYEELGAKPVINAVGNATVIGGSRLSPKVQEAAEVANRYFVSMEELLKGTGKIIADMLGAEAALVTSGCAAAIALGAAACMAGSDPEKIAQLPDTTGMKNEILIQKRQRYHYDRCLTIFGAKLVEAGDDSGTTADQLEAAITDRTAAIHYFAPGGAEGVLSPEEVVGIGKRNGIPVTVDAASQIYPLDKLHRYTGMGADLVGYGAKYLGACHSSGILCGRKDLVDAAFLHSFIGYETGPAYSVGRPLKLDRQEIVGVAVALREWFDMDHEARIAEHWQKAQTLQDALADIPHLTFAQVPEERSLGNALRITLDEGAIGKTASQITEALREGNPSIWAGDSGNSISIGVANLIDDDVQVVADRLRELLTA